MNSPQAAGNGRHRGALPVPSVTEGVLLCPVLSRVTACVLWPRFRAMLSISSSPTRHILVGFRDRQGRTIAGDKTDEWLQPACNEMYRVLKKDALMVSFYG